MKIEDFHNYIFSDSHPWRYELTPTPIGWKETYTSQLVWGLNLH